MGVRKLNKFLTNKHLVTEYKNLFEYISHIHMNPHFNNCKSGKVVIAIDFWLYAHKFLHSNKSDNIVLGFLNQAIKILSYGAIPVYVADGLVPIEKEDEVRYRTQRRERKENEIQEITTKLDEYKGIDEISPIDLDIDDLTIRRDKLQKQVKRVNRSELCDIINMFNTLDILFLRAQYEADALCTKLYKEGLITTCLSDDMDMLALGCGNTIKFNNGTLIEYNLPYIKEKLEIDQDQFIDICIMFGCGYLKHPVRIDCDRAYEIIKESGSLLDALFDC
jgi:flap endonuclease-1